MPMFSLLEQDKNVSTFKVHDFLASSLCCVLTTFKYKSKINNCSFVWWKTSWWIMTSSWWGNPAFRDFGPQKWVRAGCRYSGGGSFRRPPTTRKLFHCSQDLRDSIQGERASVVGSYWFLQISCGHVNLPCFFWPSPQELVNSTAHHIQ